MNKKRLSKVCLSLFFGFVICIFSLEPKQAIAEEVRGITTDTIKIGLIFDQTGPAAVNTVPMTRGIKSYVRYINDQGGIHGRKLKLIVEDDRYSVPMAMSAFKKLLFKDKVVALMGPSSSTALAALLRSIEKEKVPLVSVIMPEYAVKPFKRYIFTFADIYPNQMKVLIDYIIKDLKSKEPRIALAYPDNEAGKLDLASALERMGSYNIEPVTKEVLNPGAFDASSQVMNLKRAKPDYVLLCGFIPQPATVILRDMKKFGVSLPVLGSWATCAEVVIKMSGDAAKDFYAINSMSPWYGEGQGIKKMREITLKYDPGTDDFRDIVYTHGWVMAIVMIEGLKRAGKNLNGETFVEGLESIKNLDMGGLTGSISYSSTNHKGGDSWKIYKADTNSGRFVSVTGWRKAE